ncbi:MAG: Fic family protein [Chlamydiales bacterium]|nr:Fic family protein [Chlamydiales bacterium]
MGKFKITFSERTVRRWLNELITEGLVRKTGHTKSVKYIAIKAGTSEWDRVSSCFVTDSLIAIAQIKRPIFERLPVAYDLKWVDSYRPNETFYLPKALRLQLEEAGERANGQDPAGTYAHKIFNRLLIDLSYNSSRLEGNTYSLLDTEKLLLHGDSAEGKLDMEKIMILNHKEAIRYLVENAPRLEVNRTVVCTIHYLLAEGLIDTRYAGKVRDYGVRIGGSTYIPFEDPKKIENQLNKICQIAVQIINPFELSLFLLIHISYLQAFIDVNKRTARLCANIPLITNNLVPLSFNAIEVDDYMSAMLCIYELQDVRPLIDLYVYSYMRTCAAYDSTVKSLGYDEVRVRYRQQRRELVREILNQYLLGRALDTYIREFAEKIIPPTDQKSFIEDVLEDLDQLDQSRIVGMGVSIEQLNTWIRLYKKH